MHPKCDIIIFMGKTDFSADRHVQQSMILVPMYTPGVKIIRALSVYGGYDAPHGHAEGTDYTFNLKFCVLKMVKLRKRSIIIFRNIGFAVDINKILIKI
jgi:hypothetical protein